MKDKITKAKFFLDFDKELAFINGMNAEGWKLVYIGCGVFFTFVKAQPGEYVTILHADKKENISSVAAFAAQCGYENIPHPFDGLSDLMYLTGKRDVVSEEFSSDNESKLIESKLMLRKFNTFTVLYAIIAAMLLIETALCVRLVCESAQLGPIPKGEIIFTSILAAITLVYLGLFGFILKLRGRVRTKIKALGDEMNIYE